MVPVLVVEDTTEVQTAVGAALGTRCSVTTAASLAEARRALASHRYDAVVLDVSLPDGSGLELLAELRGDRRTARVPVIVLTAREAIADKLAGFAVGADDYIVKPFHPLELRARVEAHLRAAQLAQQDAEVVVGRLHVDLTRQRAVVAERGRERPLALTSTELRLLAHFAHHEGEVITRDRLLDAVWGRSVAVLDRTVDTHVSHLRKKLAGSGVTVHAVHGAGYRLVDEDANAH
jgi:DNA-binding response OmpR family regulator